jgi:AGCS family alanine or glycine:cation symporter
VGAINDFVVWLNGIVWGPLMLVLILGTGLYLMTRMAFMPLLRVGYAFRLMWRGRRSDADGDITPFNALMTALAATVGTGNIAGVATAIVLGGPGALFWMWCTALVGMATKYAETVLAVRYREVDALGNHVGGPMYYIRNGLGPRWAWLGAAFAVFGGLAGFGIGNTVQANSVADVLHTHLEVPPLASGIVMAVLVGLVLIGGIRRIGAVAGALVPFMAVAYVLGGLTILAIHITDIPAALGLIFTHAFTPAAATGGFAGAAVWAAIRFGVARGVFSNEAGLGSAPMAHAAARTNSAVGMGFIGMLGTFIDTIIICSITGLVILVSGAWTVGETGAALSYTAFDEALPGFGGAVVAFGLATFAFTTLLGWSVYGERCVEYLFGVRAIMPFRVLWTIVVPVGTVTQLEFTWLLADTLNALMAVPNLIALLLLSLVVVQLTRTYFAERA